MRSFVPMMVLVGGSMMQVACVDIDVSLDLLSHNNTGSYNTSTPSPLPSTSSSTANPIATSSASKTPFPQATERVPITVASLPSPGVSAAKRYAAPEYSKAPDFYYNVSSVKPASAAVAKLKPSSSPPPGVSRVISSIGGATTAR